jgi:hypothetical protein
MAPSNYFPESPVFDPHVVGPHLAPEISEVFFRLANIRFELTSALSSFLPRSYLLSGPTTTPTGFFKDITMAITLRE